MELNGDLFDDPMPKYQAHSETSRGAAGKILPKAGTLRLRVLDAIKRAGAFGATDDELQRSLRMDPSTQRPRRVELVEAGLVKDSSRKRSTRSGRAAVVWIAS